MNKCLNICIVSHNAYCAISGANEGFIGGVERQTSMLAKWLAAHGYETSIITWNEGPAGTESIEGVRVIKVCHEDEGFPVIRFLHPKWSSLERALKEANADLYYHNCSESVTGQIAWWCSRNHRKFVFALASDADWNPLLPEMRGWHEKALYRYGLRNADAIICQTFTQKENLKKLWQLDSSVVPMPCPRPAGEESSSVIKERNRVLWLGRVCKVKRLEWFLEVADRMPDLIFDLVGPFYDEPYANQIYARANLLKNVVLHGRIDKEEVGVFYRNASVLCCTSIYEGFPNTFLEAWSRGVPVISTFDPDGTITRESLGIHVTEVEAMIAGIRQLMGDSQAHEEISRNGLSYFEENHAIEKVMPRLTQVFEKTCLVAG